MSLLKTAGIQHPNLGTQSITIDGATGAVTFPNGGPGDLTAVSAGTGISVADGTGPIPVVTNTVATTFDAKGDLVVGTGADTFAKVTVGSNNTILVADSGETAGVKWALGTPLQTNAQTASYTLVLSDAFKLVEISNTSANTVTIPTNASVAYPTGTQINILQANTGQTTISGTAGVTVNSTGATTASPKLRERWSSATAIKRDTDSWVIVGDIE